MIDTTNSICIIGSISEEPHYDHTVCGEAFYHIEVAARRLSGAKDVVPATVSERLIAGYPDSFCKEDTRVRIKGQIRSYNRRSEERNRLLITVFARELTLMPAAEDEEAGELAEPDIAADGGEPYAEADFNEAGLVGAVCKPVVYRTTPFCREIADVLIAVNRRYGKSDYLPCIAWGRNARFAEGLCVGEQIAVRGRMQSRQYQKTLPDGTTEQRTAYEISCSSIERRTN